MRQPKLRESVFDALLRTSSTRKFAPTLPEFSRISKWHTTDVRVDNSAETLILCVP